METKTRAITKKDLGTLTTMLKDQGLDENKVDILITEAEILATSEKISLITALWRMADPGGAKDSLPYQLCDAMLRIKMVELLKLGSLYIELG